MLRYRCGRCGRGDTFVGVTVSQLTFVWPTTWFVGLNTISTLNEKYKVLSHVLISQKGSNLLTYAVFFHSLHIVLLGLLLFNRPSLTSRLKISNRSFYHSAPVRWNSLPSYVRHVAHHVTPSPMLHSPVWSFNSSCLKKLKTCLFHCFFPLYSPRLSRDW